MQNYFCPRCKFRMIDVKKHICLTCGYKIPITNHSSENAHDGDPESSRLEATPRLWSKFFKWEFASSDADSIESTQEKPVLS